MEVENVGAGKRSKRKRGAALVLGLAMSGVTNTAFAGMPVIDYTAIMQAIQSFFSDTAAYAEQAMRWSQVKQQIDEARAIFEPIRTALNAPQSATFVEVPENYMVKDECGEGASLQSLEVLQIFTGGTDDVLAQQQQICVNIRIAQNRKYNESVRFLNDTVTKMEEGALEVFMRRMKDNKAGTVQASSNEVAMVANDLEILSQKWEGQMRAYDIYINTMRANQNVLAKTALKGKPKRSLTGDLVQTALLKAALSVD